jgi:DNA-binding transcriptional LysR family regulator
MRGRCDLSIHYGNPLADVVDCRKLFQDRIIALGTPKFAAEHGIGKLEDLLSAPLVHSSSEGTDWTSWDNWFSALGYPAPKGRRFSVNNYMIALQAAQDDVGAVLGWDGLVGNLMKERRLVQIVPDGISSPAAFYLKIHSRAPAKARLFADWLVKSVEDIGSGIATPNSTSRCGGVVG